MLQGVQGSLRARGSTGSGSLNTSQPVADPFHLVSPVKQPTVMILARWDSSDPLEKSSQPLFDNLGAPEEEKRLVIVATNHGVFSQERNGVGATSLDWLDAPLR